MHRYKIPDSIIFIVEDVFELVMEKDQVSFLYSNMIIMI